MSKQVPWTKSLTERFIDLAALNSDEAYIMRGRVRGMTVVEMSQNLCKSESTIHRTVKMLKIKYDLVQKEYPDEFPVRKSSAKETYMDTH